MATENRCGQRAGASGARIEICTLPVSIPRPVRRHLLEIWLWTLETRRSVASGRPNPSREALNTAFRARFSHLLCLVLRSTAPCPTSDFPGSFIFPPPGHTTA